MSAQSFAEKLAKIKSPDLQSQEKVFLTRISPEQGKHWELTAG
jgi:hypothetical protein